MTQPCDCLTCRVRATLFGESVSVGRAENDAAICALGNVFAACLTNWDNDDAARLLVGVWKLRERLVEERMARGDAKDLRTRPWAGHA